MNFFSRFKVRFILINPILWSIALFVGIVIHPRSAIALTKSISSVTNSAKQPQRDLISRGKAAYQMGRYTQALRLWQEAHQQALTKIARAQILNYLALTSHKLGSWQQAQQYLDRSLKLLDEQKSNPEFYKVKAQTLNTKGRLELSTDNAEAALASWQEAAKIYQQVGDDVGVLGVEINQAQAWQNLGLYRRAQRSLQQIADRLESQSDVSVKIAGWRNLGVALQVTGDLDLAEQMLNRSLILAQQSNLKEESSMTLFSLGNVALTKEDLPQAIAFYQQAAINTSQPVLKTEAQLNQLGVLISQQQWQNARSLLPKIKANLSQISASPNRKLIYLQVNLAKSLLQLDNSTAGFAYSEPTQQLLNTAIQQATDIKDTQAESYALGILGHFYEQERQLSLGQKYTQKAIQLAQAIDNSELIYQWQWQSGRLMNSQGNHQGAIAAYSNAVDALESLRGDLVVTNADMQFSFRESIEPVYRQLVSLLLTETNGQPVSQDNLLQARNTIESLQLAELNNFFREACLDATPTAIDEIDTEAAVIYPIILGDRLETIVSFPDKSLRRYSQPIPQTELEPVIEELRRNIQIRSRRNFYQSSKQLYNWLIRPTLKDLAENKIKTLVFVPDGAFRNIPLGALYSGKQYLIEQYNVALTPGLQLLAPLSLEKVKLRTLAAGITQQRRGFSSLEYVNQELEDIQNQTNSLVLRDDKFTQENLRAEIKTANYPIVHIATHGQFSSNLDDTFLLAWDNDITIEELEELLQNADPNKQRAIELLILSACETARGDDRAALGLAGMAVRAGARTTLATLWTVYDESTALTMDNFYQNIILSQEKKNKANALRQAQLELLKSKRFSHPYYWAPFIMLGNWL